MNWKKELVDQPLHALVAGVGAWCLLAPWTHHLFERILVAGRVSSSLFGLIVLGGLAIREVSQKSHKPGGILEHWPWTDTLAGYLPGLVVGVWLAL